VFKNLLRYPFAFVLGLSVLALVGCDKLKTALVKLEKSKTPVSEVPVASGALSKDQITEIDQASFPAFIARKNALVIVDYHATWCGPCKLMGPVLEKAAGANPGVVFLGKVDVDKVPALAQQQGVSGIPDVRIYKDGKQVDRMVGFPGEGQVLDKIAALSRGITVGAAAAVIAPADAPKTAEPEIQPFSKGWLPPGMSKAPAKPSQRP
jgi:thioredoxin 1